MIRPQLLGRKNYFKMKKINFFLVKYTNQLFQQLSRVDSHKLNLAANEILKTIKKKQTIFVKRCLKLFSRNRAVIIDVNIFW